MTCPFFFLTFVCPKNAGRADPVFCVFCPKRAVFENSCTYPLYFFFSIFCPNLFLKSWTYPLFLFFPLIFLPKFNFKKAGLTPCDFSPQCFEPGLTMIFPGAKTNLKSDYGRKNIRHDYYKQCIHIETKWTECRQMSSLIIYLISRSTKL